MIPTLLIAALFGLDAVPIAPPGGPIREAPFISALFVDAVPMCFSSDVKAICCPAACAAKASSKWQQADEVLRGCMKGLGCSDGSTKSATVFMRCDCPTKGAQ
jgi:hypothetical protein